MRVPQGNQRWLLQNNSSGAQASKLQDAKASLGTYFPGNGTQGGTLGGSGSGNRPSSGNLGGARAPRR